MRRTLLVLALLAACKHDNQPAAPSSNAAPPNAAPAATAEPSDLRCPAGWGPMMAQQHIVDHPCTLRPAQVGCLAPDQACGDALTYAIDLDNQSWWFADTCIPEGWREAPYPQGLSGPPPACDQN